MSDSGSNNPYRQFQTSSRQPPVSGASSVGSGVSSLYSSASAQYFRMHEKNANQNNTQVSKVSQLVKMHSNNGKSGSATVSVPTKVRRWGPESSNDTISPVSTSTSSSGPAMSDPGVASQYLSTSNGLSSSSNRRQKPFPGNSPRRQTLASPSPNVTDSSFLRNNSNITNHDVSRQTASAVQSPFQSKFNVGKTKSSESLSTPRKETITPKKSAQPKNSNVSGDCVNIWIRHSILSSILSPKPSYGSSTPSRKLNLNSSFASESSLNTSLNASFTTPSKAFRNKSSTSIDDMSTISSATDGTKTAGTTSARWGWVKASLLNNDAFMDHNSQSRMSDANKSEETQTPKKNNPPWQKQLKTTIGNYSQPNNGTDQKTESETVVQKKQKPDHLIVKIVDLESEYHGLSVEIPLSSISGTTKEGSESIFGEEIVMANNWPNFTSLPNQSKSSQEDKSTPTRSHGMNPPKWASSSILHRGKGQSQVEKPAENENMDSVKIPKDLTNLTHLHEPAVVYCLRYRYAMDEIYTSTGPILLALNPFKDVKGVYGEDLMKKYCERGQGLFNGSIGLKKKKKDNQKSLYDLPPHVYAVADNAYRSMIMAMEDGSGNGDASGPDQSILVSGESGAGKTVTTKIIMKYLAALSKRTSTKNEKSASSSGWKSSKSFNFSSHQNGHKMTGTHQPQTPNGKRTTNIEQQVLESNPILESFGNARTIRNDNSSRFGKFIEIQFTDVGKLLGARIDSYLLEKVRLIKHSDGERNYHIFYEILVGLSGSERKQLLLGRSTPQDYVMTRSSSETYKRRDGVRDDSTFNSLRKAMTTMGFQPADQIDILRIVSSILHLSNLNFHEDSSSGCTLDDKNPSLAAALQLLGVSRDNLYKALCCVNIEAGGERLVKKLFLAQAIKAKEAMIKATYGALFEYLVRRINRCINGGKKNHDSDDPESELSSNEPSTPSSDKDSEPCAAFIGVLDIFGFESFQQNSFEQLCINYCNESLQQQFNKFVFKLEQAEYEREGIQWNFISFPDNQDVLDLIDKKRSGILSILDEQSFLTQCTDQSFAQSVYQKCAGGRGSPFVASTRQMARGTFSVRHYAGPVEYDSIGFIEKNKDELPKGIDDLLRSSENKFLQHLETVLNSDRTDDKALENKSTPRFNSKQSSLKRITVGGQFSLQLLDLRNRIDTTSPHYIRCLKPNDALEPDHFDSAVIADQLRCAGILEAVRVSRVGYPQRYLHKTFVQRYQVLAMKELQRRRMDASSSFQSPAGFGFHGGFVPKREKPSPTARRTTVSTEKKLNSEQECKILVNALAKQIFAMQNKENSEEEEENIAPDNSKWTSPGKQLKKWPTPGSHSRSQLPNRPMKQEINLIEIGLQMGKSKVFLRQHAFEALERMRGRIKSSAATVINAVIRMYLRRKRFLVMRNEYRARVAQRSKIIREGGFAAEIDMNEISHTPDGDDHPKFNFKEMQISLHREEDFGSKEFKWVWVDNRWVKNEEEDEQTI